MTLSPIKYKLGTSKRLGDILDYVYTQCRRSVVTRKVLRLRPCLYTLSSSRIAQRKITLVAHFIGLHFQISSWQKVSQYWLPCSLWAENQNIFYDNCRNSRALIGWFLLSISGQTHEFTICTMLQRTRADILTLCYRIKQIDVSF